MSVAVHNRLDGPSDAPVVVLANSLGTSLAMWDEHVPALTERFRVLRYDHRGHGHSPVPPGPYDIAELGSDLLALLDRYEIERASICGLSLGGMVGMWVAGHAPERVERLVLVCTSARLGPAELWTERATAVRGGGMAAVVEGVIERWFTPAFFQRRPDVIARFDQMLRATPAEGYAGGCEAIRDMDLRDELREVRAPTLVVAGAEDPATPPEHGRAIADAIAGARLMVLSRAAHVATAERPEAVTSAVLDHLAAEPTDQRSRGIAVRREVLGDEHVDRSIDNATAFSADFQDLITRYAWGEVWTRPGLDRRTRSAITLTALVALNHSNELALHVRAARRNGLTPDEIKEVLLQAAIYCGVPAANSAFAVAQRVLDELDGNR